MKWIAVAALLAPRWLAAQRVIEIYRAPAGALCTTMDPRCRAIAATIDGKLFVLAAEVQRAEGLDAQGFRLLGSNDGGLTWSLCAAWPCGAGCEGSIVADPRSGLLHVVHASRELNGGHMSLGTERSWPRPAGSCKTTRSLAHIRR